VDEVVEDAAAAIGRTGRDGQGMGQGRLAEKWMPRVQYRSPADRMPAELNQSPVARLGHHDAKERR
jgi:hypothetical protein